MGTSVMKELKIKINFKKEAAVRKCSTKQTFLKISQNSQEETCDWVSFLIKKKSLQA